MIQNIWRLKSILLTFTIFACLSFSWAQIQIGQDIEGEAPGDESGFSVSMPDEYTVAIGALENDNNWNFTGHVRVYRRSGNNWVQKGQDIDGERPLDNTGYSISMPDSNTIAIGANEYDNGHTVTTSSANIGVVRVYTWTGNSWVQKGIDLDGEAWWDKAGSAVSMPDANTVAIGAPFNGGAGSPLVPETGHVRIYSWDGNSWVRKGNDIDGEAASDQSGTSVSMPNPNTVAIGAIYNQGNGHVRVYNWNGAGWIQKGTDIDGVLASRTGTSVSMPDNNTVAIGATHSNLNGTQSGHVSVFKWSGSNWVQQGGNIVGEAAFDESGVSISMPDTDFIVIGAKGNDANGNNSGHARVFKWDGANWTQFGRSITGEFPDDASGFSVSMPSRNVVAVGAIGNDGNGINSGHVRIFEMMGVTGSIYNDLNQDCVKDVNELGIAEGIVATIQPGNHVVQTNTSGAWHIDSLPAGNYSVTYHLPAGTWYATCSNTQSFTINNPDTSIRLAPLSIHSNLSCSSSEISVFMPFQRRCFSDQNIYIRVCNSSLGSGVLDSAYVLVELDTMIMPTASSIPYTVQDGLYRFDLGNVVPGQCINFTINSTVNCDAILGQTLCVEAKLFPIDSCALDTTPSIPSGNISPCTLPWDKSSLQVNGWCQNDSIYFTITNTGDFGDGDMHCVSEVRIYLDGQFIILDSVQLAGGEIDTLVFSGDGRTWRLEADQHPMHPGNSNPNASVELCGNESNWVPDLINTLPLNDADPIVDIYCGVVTGSYDPNDKIGYPLGTTDSHFIAPDGRINYIIRFQNTGTDTAFTVVIRDTLHADLNIASVREGVSSHGYSFKMYGQRVLEWTFNDIMLPDSNVDLAGSNGFVTFTVKQVSNLADYTEITNSAAIYFDFNAPIITNRTSHIVKRSIPKVSQLVEYEIADTSCAPLIYDSIIYDASGLYYNVKSDTLAIYDLTISEIVKAMVSNDRICIGDSVRLYGTGGGNYMWNNGIVDNQMIYPTDGAEYILSSIDHLGCAGSDTIVLVVNNLPIVDAGQDTTLCLNDSIILLGFGAKTYLWNHGVVNGLAFSPIGSTRYMVIGTDSNGCQNIDSVSIRVNTLPNITLMATDTFICPSDSIILLASGAQTYIWNDSVINGEPIIPSISHTYFVTGIDTNGCQNADSVFIEVYETIPQVNFTYQLTGFEITMQDSSSSDVNRWSWSVNEDSISTMDSASYLFEQNGTYDVCLIASNDCFSDTVCQQIEITGVGIEHHLANGSIKVFPNPATNQLTFDIQGVKVTSIRIIDLTGRVVDYTVNSNSSQQVIDVSTFSKGLYFYELRDHNTIVGIGEFIKK